MSCAVLLATKNGSNFLSEQLDSIFNQSYNEIKIIVSDDGSTDNTMDILLRYQKKFGRSKFVIYEGPKQGYAQNFWSLLHRNIVKKVNYLAFCDQDDVWSADHLMRSIKKMRLNPKIPQACGSRTQYIDQDGFLLDFSPNFLKIPCFQNALVQNIAGGNTMVFNSALLPYLQKIKLGSSIVSHDWLLYQVVTAVGGKFIYLQHPSIFYRQHNANIVGRNDRLSDQMKRLIQLLKGRYRLWNDMNLECLTYIHKDITPQNKKVLTRFIKYRSQFFTIRLLKIFRLHLFRQTIKGQLGLYFGYLLKKI